MNILEAIKQQEKANQESAAAYKALKAAQAAQETAREKCRIEYKSLFNKEARENYFNSESHKAYEAAQAATAEARKKANTATAIAKAAADNVLNVTCNTLRAAILESPEKFKAPTHYKKFIEAVKAVTGNRFYIDNRMSSSFYINYMDSDRGNDSVFICEQQNGQILINPEKLQDRRPEFTLKEIKKEAKKAEKDAEKMRKAAAKLEKEIKETRNGYNTYIKHLMPDYYSNGFHDSNLF